MKRIKRRRVLIGMVALLLFSTLGGANPGARQSDDHLNRLREAAKALKEKLGPRAKFLSSGGQQFLALASMGDLPASSAAAKPLAVPSPRGFANDVNAPEDFISRFSGMTQSEPSAAWCAKNAVIGFNDTGSFMATAFGGISPSGSTSIQGFSHSADAGRTFRDRGALLPDPLPAGILFRDILADPVVACTRSSTFYYSALAIDTTRSGAMLSGVFVSKSTTGGRSFGSAVQAVTKNLDEHFLDKEWMAVDPGSRPAKDIIHLSYTDEDFSFSSPACGNALRTAVEYVRSTDGGRTWSPPLVIDEACGDARAAQSQVEVGLHNDVHVAWERYSNGFAPPLDIAIRRSPNKGVSFRSPVVVTPVTPVGDGFALQGAFRSHGDLQGLAVDRTHRPSRGSLYITWHDGRNLSQPDPLADPGCEPGAPRYCFGDVFITRSTTRGTTWSSPVQINNDGGLAVDQFFPAVEVDRKGTVWALYHDRHQDPRNFLIDTSLARSGDEGMTWRTQDLTRTSFAPVTGVQDVLLAEFGVFAYMGDYISVAVDATESLPGVISAWTDNSLGDQNVRFDKR